MKRGSASETLGKRSKQICSLKGSNNHTELFVADSDGNVFLSRPRVPFAFAHYTLGFSGLSPLATKTIPRKCTENYRSSITCATACSVVWEIER